MTRAQIKPSALLRYGLLAAPVAFAGFPLYVLAPDFYATQHGVSLAALGFTLLGLRLFDAFQDPLIGALSDSHRRWTSAMMVGAAVILCASIYGLFNFLYAPALLWFALCMGLAVTAYSILSINLNALGALWTKDSSAQTRIAASREAFGLLGLVGAVSLPPLLAGAVPQAQIYQWFGLALAALMSVALFFFWQWHRQQGASVGNVKMPTSFFIHFKSLSASTKKLLLVYVVSMIASSIPAVLVIFFVRDLLGAEGSTGFFLLLYFGSAACFMPLWQRVSLTYGKHRSWLFSMIVAVVSFIGALSLSEGDIWQYALICVTSGAALGADLVFPPSILADQLHQNGAQSNASSHYALLTLAAKVALALASAIALPLLAGIGFVPNAQNSASALMGLSIAYALVPCVLKCGAAWMLFRGCGK